METISFLASNSVDTMASSSPPTFLKLEDLHSSPPPPSGTMSFDTMTQQGSPPPSIIVHSKPAKKRKSWGQQLPQPTTNLPPRKRAKTDDEKEQRRIERIKRNRAAAHNSRERKRQETETLAVALARANAELDAYRRLHGPLPASVVLPEVTVCTDSADTPAPSLIDSLSSVDAAASPASSAASPDDLFDYPIIIKEEPSETNFPATLPPAFNALDAKQALSPLDLTQHSAAMLCDLQCRSSLTSSSSNNSNSSASISTPMATSWWTTLFLSLIMFQLQTSSKTLLLALWTLSPSRTARLMQASALRLTSRSTTSSTTPRLLRSTVALAQLNAATSRLGQQGGALAALPRRVLVEAWLARSSAAVGERHQTDTDSEALEVDTDMELDRGNEG